MQNTKRPLLRLDRASVRVIAVTVVLAGLLVVIMSLIFNVRNLLSTMERSGLDNGEWVMVQTEVEVLRLRHALAVARGGRMQEAEVDRWFNVFYSRVGLLTDSPLHATFLRQPGNAMHLRRLRAFADKWDGVMEGPPDALIAALPQIEAEAAELQSAVRGLSLAALGEFLSGTDRARAGLSTALTRLGLTTGATIAMLTLLALVLMRVTATARTRGREISATSARLQMIIATSPDAIVVTNRGGWIVEFNPAAEAMFGISRNSALQREATKALFAPQDRAAYQAIISDAIAKAVAIGPQRLEFEGLSANGRRFPLEASFAIGDASRSPLIVVFLRDISTRKAAQATLEDALRKARAGEQAKARFIAVMSHEMRTPLTGLLGSMGLMRDTVLNPEQTELLRVMQVSGDGLLGHVNAVLDLSSAEAGDVRPAVLAFDLDQVIDDCVASQAGLARNAQTSLHHVPLTGAFGAVLGDAGRVRQVLLNLIGNAVKFTSDGTVTVESERLPPRPGNTDAPWVEVRVIDTGPGIAAQDQARVFQDFETVDTISGPSPGGTGLGLGIARRLVQTMGGQIGLESALGQGSVFWVRLPLAPADSAAPEARPPTDAQPPTGGAAVPLSILIIEDNDINRFLLRRQLETAGHHVTEASDGLGGVAQAQARAFDLIVTDIAMPHLDGIEAARRIRASGGASAHARIVVLTAHAMPSDQARLDDAGIDACLTKPVSRAVLLAAIAGVAGPTPPPDTAAPALLDPSPLAEMAAMLGRPALAALLARLVAEGDSTLSQLGPDQRTARLLHQLAGGCALFGAAQMRSALVQAEQAIALGEGDVAATLAALHPMWGKTRAAILAHTDQSAA